MPALRQLGRRSPAPAATTSPAPPTPRATLPMNSCVLVALRRHHVRLHHVLHRRPRPGGRPGVWNRPYTVAVRAVTSEPDSGKSLDASDRRESGLQSRQLARPCLPSRVAGSISFSWGGDQIFSQGYQIECATRENNVTGAYTRCADVSRHATAVNGRYSATDLVLDGRRNRTTPSTTPGPTTSSSGTRMPGAIRLGYLRRLSTLTRR